MVLFLINSVLHTNHRERRCIVIQPQGQPVLDGNKSQKHSGKTKESIRFTCVHTEISYKKPILCKKTQVALDNSRAEI